MIDELSVLQALQTTIIEDVNQYLDSNMSRFSEANVIRDFPSVSLMPSDVAIFIIPDRAVYENLATTSDKSEFTVMIELLCKRDTQKNLEEKAYAYFNALYLALRRNMSLGGVVDFTELSEGEFFPAVEMNKNVQGIESTCTLHYTKDF